MTDVAGADGPSGAVGPGAPSRAVGPAASTPPGRTDESNGHGPARIEIVSASAGSGKTYRLATTLQEALAKGEARPEAVIATTFTRKAAAELQERVRRFLIERGRFDEANRLAAARIGTVNAICGQLILELPFELGRSPEMSVLDEAAAQRIFRRAIAQAVTARELHRLAELQRRMNAFNWQRTVQRIVDLSRVNGVAPEDLPACCDRSRTELMALLDPRVHGGNLDQQLLEALRSFLDEVDLELDPTDQTRGAVEKATSIYHRLQRGAIPWADWHRIMRLKPAKKYGALDLAAPLIETAERHLEHPDLHDDIEDGINITFSIAQRALESYTRYKHEWGVLDFADQELLCLELLHQPAVRARLEGEIDLILVDEFQDTSPIQLEIFLRLADLAKRSVWVGDQKQSIFAFRGTDPALMDAAVRVIAPDGPQTLDRSYRSQPSLVKLTSDIFTKAFGHHGVPENYVRLQPAVEPCPELGQPVEWWALESKNIREDALALAAAVELMLEDPEVRVRDLYTEAPRRPSPGDVAILCRTHKKCAAVANALEARGIDAVLPRSALLDTHEGRLVLAGLQRWVDPGDTLAAATIARLTTSEEEWLARLTEAAAADREATDPTATDRNSTDRNSIDQNATDRNSTDQNATDACGLNGADPYVQRIDLARRQLPQSDPLSVFDLVLEALDVRERCMRWGETGERLANLDALRGHAVATLEDAAADASATPAGMVSQLLRLRSEDGDSQAVVRAADAVTVSTWHAAKGLEWPITVLFDLDKMWMDNLLGVSIGRDHDQIDLANPLAGRWVRCWVNPYHPMMSTGRFFERLAEHSATGKAKQAAAHEDLRLLYVGWTRARDRLVLAARDGHHTSGLLGLEGLLEGTRSIFAPPEGNLANWAGHTTEVIVRRTTPEQPPTAQERRDAYPVPAGRRDHPRAAELASRLMGVAPLGQAERLGPRTPLRGLVDMSHLGEAVHSFLAADDPSDDPEARRELAAGLLARWRVSEHLDSETCMALADRLWEWLGNRWPGAAVRTELPLVQRRHGGALLRGTVDCVVFADDGLIVIDHKTFPGDEAAGLARAAGHAGQLAAYADALRAAVGADVLGAYIHMPVLGVVVPLKLAGMSTVAVDKAEH